MGISHAINFWLRQAAALQMTCVFLCFLLLLILLILLLLLLLLLFFNTHAFTYGNPDFCSYLYITQPISYFHIWQP